MVARRTSGVSEGLAEPFFFGVGEADSGPLFFDVDFFFFFPFDAPSFAGLPAEALAEAGDFFGFGCVVASGVSLGVADASASSDFFFLGVGDGADSSFEDFFGLDFFFGDGESEVRAALALDWPFPEVVFFFLPGEAFDFGEGVGVFSLAGESTARAFKIGLPSSVCCA